MEPSKKPSMTARLEKLPVAPKITVQVIPCHSCGKQVYPFERIPAGGKSYHKQCVRCCICHAPLFGVHFSWIAHEGRLFCPTDVPNRPMRVKVDRSPSWDSPTLFDRLAGMSDIVLEMIELLRPRRFASFTEQHQYTERYVDYGKQLMTLKLACSFFCKPLAKWNNMGIADYAAYRLGKERGAPDLVNGRASGWAQVLASGELDRWEFAEARRLHLQGDQVCGEGFFFFFFCFILMIFYQEIIKALYGGKIPFIEHGQRAATYCFSGDGLVELASGAKLRVAEIQPGTIVRTQYSTQAVRRVFKEELHGPRPLVLINGFYLTRRHPVFWEGAWRMPTEVGTLVPDAIVPAIYNFELAGGEATTDHEVWINGLVVCTLGKAGLPTTKEQDEIYGSGYWHRTKA